VKTLKLFIWFTRESWAYKRGEHVSFFRHFVGAWRTFYQLEKQDKIHPEDLT
jgi:hypothetical protein